MIDERVPIGVYINKFFNKKYGFDPGEMDCFRMITEYLIEISKGEISLPDLTLYGANVGESYQDFYVRDNVVAMDGFYEWVGSLDIGPHERHTVLPGDIVWLSIEDHDCSFLCYDSPGIAVGNNILICDTEFGSTYISLSANYDKIRGCYRWDQKLDL